MENVTCPSIAKVNRAGCAVIRQLEGIEAIGLLEGEASRLEERVSWTPPLGVSAIGKTILRRKGRPVFVWRTACWILVP